MVTLTTPQTVEEAEPIRRLSRDLLLAAEALSPAEVRYIVDGYYQIQEYRKAAYNQVRAAQEAGEPALLLLWLAQQAEVIEGQIKRAMEKWAESRRPGRWAMDQMGLGPVLTSGLLAHLDITRAPTVGHFWTFAGLNPESQWLGHEKAKTLYNSLSGTPAERLAEAAGSLGRNLDTLMGWATRRSSEVTAASAVAALARPPFNRQLKVVCWRLGDSFVKVSGRDGAVYGQAYRERKAQEVERNEAGKFRDQAEAALKRPNSSPGQRAYYEKGLLPPGRIDLRARRWAVKLFLAHLHHVMHEDHFGTPPPKPYVIEHLGHTHYMGPPGWPRD